MPAVSGVVVEARVALKGVLNDEEHVAEVVALRDVAGCEHRLRMLAPSLWVGNGSRLPPYASSASSRRPGIGQITIRLASTSISRTTSRMAGMRTSPKGPRTTYTSLARV